MSPRGSAQPAFARPQPSSDDSDEVCLPAAVTLHPPLRPSHAPPQASQPGSSRAPACLSSRLGIARPRSACTPSSGPTEERPSTFRPAAHVDGRPSATSSPRRLPPAVVRSQAELTTLATYCCPRRRDCSLAFGWPTASQGGPRVGPARVDVDGLVGQARPSAARRRRVRLGQPDLARRTMQRQTAKEDLRTRSRTATRSLAHAAGRSDASQPSGGRVARRHPAPLLP